MIEDILQPLPKEVEEELDKILDKEDIDFSRIEYIMKKIIYLTLAFFAFVSCNKQNEIQHTFYGAVLGQIKEQVCDSLDKNHITYDEWSMSYLDYDYLEIKQPELAGYAFTESTFEIDRETKVVYAARFIKEKINKEFYLEFLKKLEAKYPMVKVDKPDLYQGNMGYEGEQHTYRFGDYYLVYTYYAPQQIIEVDYFYSPQRINDL